MIAKRTLLGAILGVALLTATAQAQISRTRIYSRPGAPSTEELRRLNLMVAWRAAVPMGGRRDGVLRIDLDRRDLFVLTRSGEIVRLDAETGVQKWRTRVDKAYTLMPFFAANGRSVYVIANAHLYGLDRRTGTRKWDLPLRRSVSASPIVDEEQIYSPESNNTLSAFYLPFVASAGGGETRSLIYNLREAATDARPRPVWEEPTGLQLAFRPLQTADLIFVISPSGKGSAYTKVSADGGGPIEVYRFASAGKIRAPLGQFGDTAYIGSDDAMVYAMSLTSGKLQWRHTAGTSIIRQPIALDKDVYVTSAREGLARLDRASGDPMWKIPRGREIVSANPDADRFLAANNKFVYASDTSGRLLVLDRKRGIRLSMLDTTAFRVPVVNEVTDRIYLAANDGLILCLHDRDQLKPLRHRLTLEQASSPVTKQLEEKISDIGNKPISLRDTLNLLRGKYKVRFVVAERAFKEAGNEGVLDKLVTIPRIDNRPLKELIQKVLVQADAAYQIVEDTLLVIPAGKAKGK